ncbi:hypothetical protein ACO229_23320 [Promicromonospora sp. MS192]|uniref:hypothetical protein n=1 Tax=Promicromonospora sp. MS192 TaxID=3412684 RepID=UPI003C2B4298
MPTNEPKESAPGPYAPPIRLVGGVNFSTWPDLKWSRANTHYATLQARFAEWQASAPAMVEGILREDREAIDLVARIPRGIPTQEWALTIGDALHNLRSALDAVAWGMAHYNDTRPNRPKRVAFPISTEERQWQEALKAWISDIDPEFQHRLSVVQPFNYAPEGGITTLSVVHDLDVQDKHRDFVTVSADFEQVDLSFAIQYEEDVDVNPRIELRNGVRFADGALLGTVYTEAPIKPFTKMELRPTMRVLLEHNGRQHEVGTALPQLFSETRRCLDILMFGLEPADPPGDSDWQTLDVQTVDN